MAKRKSSDKEEEVRMNDPKDVVFFDFCITLWTYIFRFQFCTAKSTKIAVTDFFSTFWTFDHFINTLFTIN